MMRKTVYLMRGLPSCGKSYTARRLAGDTGIVCETDEYFYTQVGSDPTRYDYDEALLAEARRWNFERFRDAVLNGQSLVVVDRGNSLNAETQKYGLFAVQHGYHVELKEPESAWWQEIRELLEGRPNTNSLLDRWADRLAEFSRSTHRVPRSIIRDWMSGWRCDLTVAEILRGRR